MAYRFTNTEKWKDSWFSNLKQIEMLLFIYLCENCDIAGFIEINYKRWASDLNSSESTIKESIKGLERGLIISNDGECLYIKNFIKHQKNLPLNENNRAHIGIIKRFEMYRYKFDIQDINDFILRGLKAPSKGLQSPRGIGIGNNNIYNNTNIKEEEKEKEKEEKIKWKKDFEEYKKIVRNAYIKVLSDKDWVKKQQEFYPNVNIAKSVEKMCVNYWATPAGWQNKKKSKAVEIDWKQTFTNALSKSINKVYNNG